VLAAESALTCEHIADAEAAAARATGALAQIDARLRELAAEQFAGPKQTVTDR
jgi:hypothetical protein